MQRRKDVELGSCFEDDQSSAVIQRITDVDDVVGRTFETRIVTSAARTKNCAVPEL